jgi:predicted nucleic acid-binding Zn ribbon protein
MVTWKSAEHPDDDFDDLESPEDNSEDDLSPCPQCGAVIFEDAERCPACGEYVIRGPRRPSLLATAVIVILILGMLVMTLAY